MRAGTNDIERAIGRVVRARQMGKHQATYARVLQRRGELRGLLVGEVTERPQDAPLQPRWVWSRPKQLGAMVRFEQNEIAFGEKGAQIPRDVAEVRRDCEAAVAGRNPQRNVRSVVRDGQRFDYEWTKGYGFPRHVAAHFETTPRSPQQRSVVCKERRTKRARERQSVRGMIAVIVRDEQAERSPGRHQVAAERAHLPDGTRRIHSRIDEKALAAGLDDKAVAVRATSKDPDFHATGVLRAAKERRHRRTRRHEGRKRAARDGGRAKIAGVLRQWV